MTEPGGDVVIDGLPQVCMRGQARAHVSYLLFWAAEMVRNNHIFGDHHEWRCQPLTWLLRSGPGGNSPAGSVAFATTARLNS